MSYDCSVGGALHFDIPTAVIVILVTYIAISNHRGSAVAQW